MNKALLAATLLAIALTACSKKEEAAATLPAPATAPALPNASVSPEPAKPLDPAPAIPGAPVNPAPAAPSTDNNTAR